MYRSRSRERYRSPSPSSKRRKHTHYSDRSSRSRSRSIDRDERSHRHRSSQRHSSHRSSRYYDDYYDSSSRRHDYPSDSRSRDSHSSSRSHRKDATPHSSAVEAETQKTAQPDKEELLRQRREQLAKWKKEREAAKKAEEEAKAKTEAEARTQAQAEENQAASKAAATAEKQQQQRTEQETVKTVASTEMQEIAKDDQKETETLDKEHKEDQVAEEGKKWSLEDDEEDEDVMDTDTAERESADAERSFKPLNNREDDDAKDETFGSKQLGQLNGKDEKKQAAMKPKTSMKIGFGLGKSMVLKKPTPGKNNSNKSPAGGAKTETKTPEPKKDAEQMDIDGAEDVDPLEAYMMDVRAEARKINEEDKKRMNMLEKTSSNRMDADEDEAQGQGDEDEEQIGSEPEDILAMAAKKVKKKDLAAVDHSQIEYEPFRKDFYIEPPELRDMTPDQVEMLRIELDGIKIRGVNCPKPILKWTHCGLPAGCLEVIKKLKFEKPTAIQAQGIPAIMNGRDVIGVAKTGSGKTIAFLLPMFRHIKDQRPLEMGEGPIAVIMTPTRELATQIHRECKPFLKVLGLRAVCAYGGSPIKDQIADLKRGAEIIVCTPGRMIDLLCANSGRVTNLRRTTYLVLDEADRMFDMGFEPQVMKIVNNVRPSKQTVLFSATFPRQMEALARKVLKKPLEITVGGRSVVCNDVEQHVEVIEESTKFVRLLEILGDFFNKEEDGDSRALVFVDRQEAADNLLRDLIRRGYLCQSLHGGKDQADRNSTISDFKSGVSDILIATSVAARGLDVKQLKLVVNYECPNHMEDYVHRVGRTGRAGNKGTAYTFITPDQGRYALDICKALKLSGQEIPPALQELMDKFQEKVKAGEERFAGSGFGGKGLERFDKDRDMVKRIQKRAYGGDDMEESDEEELLEEIESKMAAASQPQQQQQQQTAGTASPPVGDQPITPGQAAAAAAAAAAQAEKAGKGSVDQKTAAALAAKKAAAEVAARINAMAGANKHRAHEVVADINNKFNAGGATRDDSKGEGHPVYTEEIVINDYPQKARWRVTNKEQISQITEISGAAITTRGTFFPPGKQPGPGERKLYLFIEGDSELVVEKAKNEIKRILVEATVAQMEAEARTGGGTGGRYSVV